MIAIAKDEASELLPSSVGFPLGFISAADKKVKIAYRHFGHVPSGTRHICQCRRCAEKIYTAGGPSRRFVCRNA
jgi:hypothetical protein